MLQEAVNNGLTCMQCAEALYSGFHECVFYHTYCQEGSLLFWDKNSSLPENYSCLKYRGILRTAPTEDVG